MVSVSCHCQAIKFQAPLELDTAKATRCNCTICTKRGHTFVHGLSFKDLGLKVDNPSELPGIFPSLKQYKFHRHRICHWFCGDCGCTPFAIFMEGNFSVALSLNCIDFQDANARASLTSATKVKYYDSLSSDLSIVPGDQPGPHGAW